MWLVEMTKKSIWDSNLWKAVVGVSIILTIIASILTSLQILGTISVWNILVVPVINFFILPVPLYSIPLSFLVIIGGFFLILFIDSKLRPSSSYNDSDNPMAGTDMLDTECYRYVAQLAKIPQTADFLKEKYQKYRDYHMLMGGYSSEELMKQMEERGLLVFQNGKWEVTQKALTYIDKYHGGK
jgi:hypothetical protein